ncbi:MAG: hypothetical protein ACLR8Y_05600 [Alistipes indistinctus]
MFNKDSHAHRLGGTQQYGQRADLDCPHREKLGWLEVTHLMGGSIQYRYDISRLYAKQVNDMRTAQHANGMVPTIAPQYVTFSPDFIDTPEWGSAFVIIPWNLYEWYGDLARLRDNYMSG